MDVPRNDFTEQAEILSLAKQGTGRLVWNRERKGLQARAPLRAPVLPAGFERRRPAIR